MGCRWGVAAPISVILGTTASDPLSVSFSEPSQVVHDAGEPRELYDGLPTSGHYGPRVWLMRPDQLGPW